MLVQNTKFKIFIDKTEPHPLVKLISRIAGFSLSHCHKRRSDDQNLLSPVAGLNRFRTRRTITVSNFLSNNY